ncbi:hypothetical protein PCORN_11622 [Listeria cornellensis FSL F6-0969]|uniref:WxL Interacting Protein host binding domain-containing protein n=1 Tax=Listeria cornellensis FSL F6-0969 TaxID=1265820 RepID=W7BTR7_9LIST|nr:DUF3324 domain-containing protein [Listeria cornellensis]EUJ29117.1 hypothetical protein PCORN_11622 [Listeria cornellensis FSL F6-0969]
MDVTASVYKQGDTNPIKKQQTNNLRMAPNSNFDYAIKWDNQKFKPGKYKMVIDAKSKGQTWHLRRNFTINSKEADKLNSTAINLEQESTPVWLYVGIGIVCALLVGVVAYYTGRRRNQKGD